MRRPLLFWCVAILAAFYCAILLGAGDLIRTDLAAYAGEEVCLTGRVVSVTRYEDYTRVVLRANSVECDATDGDLEHIRETVLLTLTGDWNHLRLAGSEVTVWTTLRIPAGKRNPGGFDYRMYLRGKSGSKRSSRDRTRCKRTPG